MEKYRGINGVVAGIYAEVLKKKRKVDELRAGLSLSGWGITHSTALYGPPRSTMKVTEYFERLKDK